MFLKGIIPIKFTCSTGDLAMDLSTSCYGLYSQTKPDMNAETNSQAASLRLFSGYADHTLQLYGDMGHGAVLNRIRYSLNTSCQLGKEFMSAK